MATEALKKFAEELKFTRESKEISLQQIANKTRIDLKFLTAIENANFDVLPDIYVKAFIKEYALLVDLDPAETVQKYNIARTGKSEQPEQIRPLQATKDSAPKERADVPEYESEKQTSLPKHDAQNELSKNINPGYIYGGVIAVLVLVLVYMIFIHGSSPDIIRENLTQETLPQNNSRFEVENQKPVQKDSVAEPAVVSKPDSLHIRLQTSARVWVKVNADGKILRQEVVQPDTKLNYAASKFFSVSVGNAGVVKLFFNDKPVSKLGNLGEIRNVFLSADTIRYLTIPPKPKDEKKPSATN